MKKRNKISFALPLAFGQTVFTKAHKYDTKWTQLTGEEIVNLKIKDLLGDGNIVRVVFEGKVKGQKIWIATHDDDYQQIRMKYPHDLCLHVGQIYKTFSDPGIIESVLMPAAVLEARAV